MGCSYEEDVRNIASNGQIKLCYHAEVRKNDGYKRLVN